MLELSSAVVVHVTGARTRRSQLWSIDCNGANVQLLLKLTASERGRRGIHSDIANISLGDDKPDWLEACNGKKDTCRASARQDRMDCR